MGRDKEWAGCSIGWLLAVLLASFVSGCAGDGTGLDEQGVPASGNAQLAALQADVFSPICAQPGGCHAGSNAQAGLRLDSAGASYATMVGEPSIERPDLVRINPGDPETSYVVWKIEGRPGAGQRMPLAQAALASTQISAIRDWVAAGAPGP